MSNIRLLMDTRRAKSDGTFNIICRITHFKKVYTINSGVSLQLLFWNDKKMEVAKTHPNSKLLNIKLSKHYFKIQQALLMLDDDFTIEKLKAVINGKSICDLPDTFQVFADKIIQQMMEVKRTGNAIVYQTAVNRLIAFCGRDISFEEVNYTLLDQFSYHLLTSGLKQNSVSNYFRSIRAIFNKAIKLKLIDRSFYPFHDISIKSEKTAKRAISRSDIIKLINLDLEEHSASWFALNYFLLSYYFIGISFTDLAYLKPENIVDGRLIYTRRKTHKIYSIRIFPEAEKLLFMFSSSNNRYLLPILNENIPEDTIIAKRFIQQWIKNTNKQLKRLSENLKIIGTVTTYVARHTFASSAKRLGYSNELIAEALGHQFGNRITNIYLDDFDKDVVDFMHQQVISS
jgi:integrase/recombinase XerD